MKKEPLFFTEKTEIGAQHVPIDSKKFAEGGLIAPNGKPSKLTPTQYKLVRTPEFKAWFGDWENDPENASKVIDENGEPLVVYHGTQFKFSIFDKNHLGKTTKFPTNKLGFYFSGSKLKAKNLYAKFDRENINNIVLNCFLRIINPFNTTAKEFYRNDEEFKVDRLKKQLEANKNDGIIVLAKGLSGHSDEYTAFEPNQIKLADGTNTTFDPNSDDIRFEEGGTVLLAPNGKPSNLTPEQYKLVRTPEFKAWFGDWENDPENASKVIDENGEPLVVYHGTTKYFTIFNKKYATKNTKVNHGYLGHFFTPNFDLAIDFTKKDWTNPKSPNKSNWFYAMKCFLNIKNPKSTSVRGFTMMNTTKDTQNMLKEYGYDGVIVNKWEDDEKESWITLFGSKGVKEFDYKQFVAFNSNQIKLADGTNTTFDPNNPDTRFKDGGSIENEKIVCHNCGWSWKVEEGGDDLYKCHKCGCDNTDDYSNQFAGGGNIDINEPFNVNGKTLAERVRILVKQLYPDYKWSITSSYNKLDIYLLEADFDPFTDKWREEYPTRELYYNVDNRDFEDYNRQYNAKITDRAVEVFKPIREYIDKFVYNRNADDPYADYSDYNVYEYTYIGKWDKPYKQVEPKAGKKKPKAPAPPTKALPFKMGDVLALSQDKLNSFSPAWAEEFSQHYYEVAESINPFSRYLIKFDSENDSVTITVEVSEILESFVKATKPLFKKGDLVVLKNMPIKPSKVEHRSYYQQNAIKYSTPEKKFLLSGMYWNYKLESGTFADEGELELYNPTTSTTQKTGTTTPEPKFNVGDLIKYTGLEGNYRVIKFSGFDPEYQENTYEIQNVKSLVKGEGKESRMTLINPSVASNNVFSIQNIISKTQWSEGLKKTMIEDFVNSGYENVTPLIGRRADNTSNNIQNKVDGFASGKNTYLQANYIADLIHILIDAGNAPIPATPSNAENTFIDYLKTNNEKANEISKELEVTTSLAMFVMGSKDIANLDSKKYAELMEEFLSKFPKLIEDDSTNAN